MILFLKAEKGAAGRFRYFSGTTPGNGLRPMKNAEFEKRFPGVQGKRDDSFSKLVTFDEHGTPMPVTRVIDFKKNPSLHKCDARCRHAKGNNCECSCGGQFHGAGD